MANPFFSGRIPPGLADKIDAHLLTTGETRSELLIRLLRTEVSDNKEDDNDDEVNDIKRDNVILDLIARVETLEKLLGNRPINKVNLVVDNKDDNSNLEPSNWVDLSTVAAHLEVLAKSISGAASKRGRPIDDDAIEFEIAGKTIQKQGSGVNALYRILHRPE